MGHGKRRVPFIGVAGLLLVAGFLVWSLANKPAESARPLLDEIEESLKADQDKGRFTGTLGDFAVYSQLGSPPREADPFRCPGGERQTLVTDTATLQDHELWSPDMEPTAVGFACSDGEIRLINNSADEGALVSIARGYFSSLPLPTLADAPRDRLELIEVQGRPTLAENPIEGYPYSFADVVAIERYPEGSSPGIAVIVEYARSTGEAIEIAQGLIR